MYLCRVLLRFSEQHHDTIHQCAITLHIVPAFVMVEGRGLFSAARADWLCGSEHTPCTLCEPSCGGAMGLGCVDVDE